MISGAPTFTGFEHDIDDVMTALWTWPDACCFPAMTRDGVNQFMKVKAAHHKQARQCRSLPIMERTRRETPYQDYQRIKSMVLAKADLKGVLTTSDFFVDACFPPDRSSLTYVYSGDDKYEKTVFKRPKEIYDTPSLIGVGGICDEPFPWQHWKQRAWFHAALVVVSLSVRALERLLPGFRKNEQNFESDYLVVVVVVVVVVAVVVVEVVVSRMYLFVLVEVIVDTAAVVVVVVVVIPVAVR
ncbi:calpain-3-like [Elysia marginata]|uniref:Calpain-3-like n=1 Tax=Elysia marginata TaxID=1093978 RepID=A0AAV4GCQ0_9GAST|nr:calpain-3-like [Elysia marginata]